MKQCLLNRKPRLVPLVKAICVNKIDLIHSNQHNKYTQYFIIILYRSVI